MGPKKQNSNIIIIIIIFEIFIFEDISGGARGLLLALCPGTILDGAWGSYDTGNQMQTYCMQSTLSLIPSQIMEFVFLFCLVLFSNWGALPDALKVYSWLRNHS